MKSRTSVCVMTQEQATAERIRTALDQSDDYAASTVCHDLAKLATYLERVSAPAALIDIDGHPDQTLAALEKLVARFDQTRFVVVSGSLDGQLVLGAMQAGACHYVVKQSLEAELANALRRVVCPAPAQLRVRGKAITVFSAGGGCGATTLAVNLANELHLLSESSALLLDLDVSYGAVATYLGLSGDFSIADVLSHPGEIDAQLITSTALRHSDHLHALINPSSVNGPNSTCMSFDQLGHALQICKQAYPWTIVDAPRLPIDIAVELAQMSDLSVIVFQMSVKDIRTARSMWKALAAAGVTTTKMRLIANRFKKRGPMVDLCEATEALRGVTPIPLRNDFRSVNKSIDFGMPLSACAPRSPYRRDVQRLAADLSGTLQEGAPI